MPVLTTLCPYCGGDAVRMDSSRHVYRMDYGPIYDCRPCDAYVGVNKLTGDPLGTPANKPLRKKRSACHLHFDQLWRGGQMTRGDAYSWLAKTMGLTKDKAHIAMFNLEQCEQLLRVLDPDGRA